MTEAVFPRRFGPYVLAEPLGEGGMGEVFLGAPTSQTGRAAAQRMCLIKTLKPNLVTESMYVARFLDEARVVIQLKHPNICHVFEAGEVKGQLFIAMEFIHGVTFNRLRALLEENGRSMTTEMALMLGIGLLSGLDGAHKALDEKTGKSLGVIHRDVSPHNAMVDVNGRISVIDFGLAASVLKETRTESNMVVGKIAYMAPEQARGEEVDARADQFAATMVIYELLANDRYYGDLATRSIWGAAGSGTFRPRAWDKIPDKLKPVLAKGLSADPKERFASCGDLAAAILEVTPRAGTWSTGRAMGDLIKSLGAEELLRAERAKQLLAFLPAELISSNEPATTSVQSSSFPEPPPSDPGSGHTPIVNPDLTPLAQPKAAVAKIPTTSIVAIAAIVFIALVMAATLLIQQ